MKSGLGRSQRLKGKSASHYDSKLSSTSHHLPALSRILWAVGCHSIRWTLRICASKVATGSVRLTRTPSSGICHIIMVQSSEALAITSSLCGHHLMSNTAALCPLTSGWSRSTRPVCNQQYHRVRLTCNSNKEHYTIFSTCTYGSSQTIHVHSMGPTDLYIVMPHRDS